MRGFGLFTLKEKAVVQYRNGVERPLVSFFIFFCLFEFETKDYYD